MGSMFGGFQNSLNIFGTMDFWTAMGISKVIPERRFKECFGEKILQIRSIDVALDYLMPIMKNYQEKMVYCISTQNSKMIVGEIYKVFDKCFHFYLEEKADRRKIVELNIADAEINAIYESNKAIAMNIIAASNVWLENCVLLQSNLDKQYETNVSDIDPLLMVDLYIYGAVSQAISMLSLSKRLECFDLFKGLDVDPTLSNPLIVFKDHPIIYYGSLLAGNQQVFSVTADELSSVNESSFGKGFLDEYGVLFKESLRIISTFQKYSLREGEYACIGMTKEQFCGDLNYYSQGLVDKEKFWDTFVLTKEKLQHSKNKKDKVIWKIGTNKERHEIRPILCFDDGTVFIAHQAFEQAKQIWLSYYTNGGVSYTNIIDKFTVAEEIRCNELAQILVRRIQGYLKKKYKATFIDTDVDYKRIFGSKSDDYGDYDVVFYTEETHELFLIEAKYFSDSLYISSMINDFEKLYSDRGYYYHCRRRYDLALQEPEKLKEFVGAGNETLKVHMLFVSSKPLEIDLQDKDGIVTFVPLCIFEKYIDGKLISEDGTSIMRPVKLI